MQAVNFSAVTNEVLNARPADGSPIPLIASRCPALVRHIRSEKTRPGMLRLWGQSRNIDENTGEIIVAQPVIEALGTLSGVEMRHPIVHAGVTHTYGYLFSIIETPFGQKRDRWVRGEIAQTLGISESLLAATPRTGTLLANATYVLGRIAFRGRSRELQSLRSLRPHVPGELHGLDYANLSGHRIVEVIKCGQKVVQIVTDLVETPHPSDQRQLLVYWWSEVGGRGRLITAFPVRRESVTELTSPQRCGDDVEIAVRFNGYIETLDGAATNTYRGSRSLSARASRFEPLA